MHAGRLHHTVRVERNTPTRDAAGQPIDAWATYCTRRAAVSPLSARERRVGQQQAADTTHIVTLRSDATTRAITPQMRIVWGDRTLHVTRAYDLSAAREWVEIEAVEKL